MPEFTTNSWTQLRAYTDARIALGRAGCSLPTRANLQFQWDHARARDAVLQPLDFSALAAQLTALGLPVEIVASKAENRRCYLQRPDLGRQLQESDWHTLRSLVDPAAAFNIAIAVADGLSSAAVQAHALPLLQLLIPALKQANYRMGPLCLAQQGRVALGDDIGEALAADLVLVLIGERPGLSSPDSLGVYLTFAPECGRSDAERNCVSNIRPQGQSYQQAAATCEHLIAAAFRKGLSGVQLKDESATLEHEQNYGIPFFSD